MHDLTHRFEGTISPEKEKIAKIISLIEQPPFVCIPVFVSICMALSDNLTTGILCSLVSILFATILPVAIVAYYAKKTGNAEKLDVVKKEDRIIPLIIGVLSYFIGVGLLYYLSAPNVATILMLCYAVVTAAIALITPFWKISIHSCGIIGPSIGLAIAFWPWGLLYFLLLPPVVWSRYVLKKHTPLQLLMGAVVGFTITAILFWIFL